MKKIILGIAFAVAAIAGTTSSFAATKDNCANADTTNCTPYVVQAYNTVAQGTVATYNKTKTGVENAYNTVAAGTEATYSKAKNGTENAYNTVATGTKEAADTIASGTVQTYEKAKEGTVKAYDAVKNEFNKIF